MVAEQPRASKQTTRPQGAPPPIAALIVARLLEGKSISPEKLDPATLSAQWLKIILRIYAAGDNVQARHIAYEAALQTFPVDLRRFIERQVDNAWQASEVEDMPVDEASADPWQPYTLEDAYTPRPEHVYAVEGQLRRPSLNFTYSHPGALKSMLLADQAACIAAGRDWLPPSSLLTEEQARTVRPFKTNQTPVVWIDYDNGPEELHARFEAIARHYKLPPELPLYYYSLCEPVLDATDPQSMYELTERIKRLNAGVVIVDNFQTVIGDLDTAKPEVRTALQRFRLLAHTCQCAVNIIHHERKTNGIQARKGETLAGSVQIEAACDRVFYVERAKNSDVVTVSCTKSRGAPVKSYSAEFKYIHKENSPDLQYAYFVGMPAEENIDSDAVAEEAIIAILKERGAAVPKTELAQLAAKRAGTKKAKVSINAARNIIDEMNQAGKVIITEAKGNKLLVSLPDVE